MTMANARRAALKCCGLSQMTDPQIAEIAAKLTAAQRAAIEGAIERVAAIAGSVMQVNAGGATIALCKKGMIRNIPFQSFSGRRWSRIYVLTDTGKAVAAYLKEQNTNG